MKIEGDEHLSPNIPWAPKTPKTTNLWAARIQVSVEAFVFKNAHLGFIKFWLISSETNACYILWWNMRSLQGMNI